MTSIFAPAKTPKTALGYHRILGPQAGVRVSPLCLGAMSIGDEWKEMGHMTKDQSFKLLDAFYAAGGNFIDTACNYQNEQSEKWIGEWMKQRNNRDEMVIATKYTTPYLTYKHRDTDRIGSNYGGNHSKSLHLTLRDSLAKLQTDYIDILYLHWWDYTSSVEEVMRSLDAVVKSGKILYLGISDTPAWIVSKANMYAKAHGLTPFVIYQGLWNVMIRDFEREIIPMCVSEGLALAPWGALGQGKFMSAAAVEERKKSNETLRGVYGPGSELQTDQEKKVSSALEKVSKDVGASITAVALAYVMQRTPYVFPIIGGRKVEHLNDNIKGLEITLSDEQIHFLESQSTYDSGFPTNMLGEDPMRDGETTNMLIKSYSNLKWVKHPHSIGGSKM